MAVATHTQLSLKRLESSTFVTTASMVLRNLKQQFTEQLIAEVKNRQKQLIPNKT